MQNAKQGWDTRAWLVGILGGLGGGILSACARYAPFARRINVATHFTGVDDWIFWPSVFLSLLVLPGLLTAIARRRTFLWGLLPLMLVLTVSNIESWVTKGVSFMAVDSWQSFAVLVSCWLISSGPVSLIRYGRAHIQRKRQAGAASFFAQRDAPSILQEGVWPPPPGYRD